MNRGYLYFLTIACGVTLFTAAGAQFSSDYGTQADDDTLAYCNRETAYSTGVSDARKGLARKEDYARICRTNHSTINGAYTTGYNYGLTNQSGLVVNEPSPYHPEIQDQLPSSYVAPYTRPVTTAANPNIRAGDAHVASVPGSGRSVASATSNNSQASRPPVAPSEVRVPSGDLAKPDPEHGLRSLIEVGTSPYPKCIETPTGEACGYNCVNSLNNVRCASTPDQVCRSNELGIIACGYHCLSTPKTVRCALYSSDLCVADSNGNVYCGVNCRIERNAIGVCAIERYMPN